MLFSAIVAALGLLLTVTARPAVEVDERAVSPQYRLRIKAQTAPPRPRILYVDVLNLGQGDHLTLVERVGPERAPRLFSVSNGSLHYSVFQNGGSTKKVYSTNNIFFADFLRLYPGPGMNNQLIINKTDSRLTFKAKQSNSPDETDFRLCPLTKPKGTMLKAVSLGDAGTGQDCEKIFLKAVPQ